MPWWRTAKRADATVTLCAEDSRVEPNPAPSGVLVIAVWSEGPDGDVRARLTSTLDASRRQHAIGVASGVDNIVELVDEWLRYFRHGGR